MASNKSKYKSARDYLPAELIIEIQKHIPAGGYLWVPSKRIMVIEARNQGIFYQRRVLGYSLKMVAANHAMSTRRVSQIIRDMEKAGVDEDTQHEIDERKEIEKNTEKKSISKAGRKKKPKRKKVSGRLVEFKFDDE